MTSTAVATAPNAPVLAIGEAIAAQAGRFVITLRRVRAQVWTVETYAASHRIEDNCSSWDDERAAGANASALLALYRTEA